MECDLDRAAAAAAPGAADDPGPRQRRRPHSRPAVRSARRRTDGLRAAGRRGGMPRERKSQERQAGEGCAGGSAAMNDGDARRGMILFAVLWAVAFCEVLAIATSMTFRGLAGVVALDRDRGQADALLNAGLEAAAGIVASVGDAPLIERETTIPLSTGSVRVRVTDEGGRIDVGKAP